jgi:hypothetical protein
MVRRASEYHLAASRRGEWSTPWIWEIFRWGKPLTIRVWAAIGFRGISSCKSERKNGLAVSSGTKSAAKRFFARAEDQGIP